jgi:Protein of unknown function (DUF3105)
MGSNAQRRREARERVQQMRRDEESTRRRRNSMVGIGLAVLVVLAVGGVAWAVKADSKGGDDPAPASIQGVETFNYKGGDHVDTGETVEYVQSPPVGGPHDGTWQNCGIYSDPIRNENAVHSLEHGAVWITYDPELPQSDIETLQGMFDDNYLLMSPYPDQKSPVVLTAWNTQLKVDSVSDPRIAEFVTAYRQGPQTPEPGAACDGGTSDTAS